ncbi:MAG: N-acetyltransferase [Candidatus Neomarinimicrobiota bacterium]
MLTVQTVETKSQLKKFIKFPWRIYRNDPNWVPPLIMDRMAFLDRKKNPFFRHSEAQLLLAERDGEPAGRIAAVHYTRHLETYQDGRGFFGFFECVDDHQVASALFNAASRFLAGRGLTWIRGPMNFTINDEVGLLVDGFNTPPVIMMTYNPPYYEGLITQYGFEKVQDLYAYKIVAPEAIPNRLERAFKLLQEKHEIRIRNIDMKDFEAEVDRIHEIHMKAWAGNWGAVPLTRSEIRKIAKDLKMIIDPDLVFMLEAGKEPVGVSVTIPDVNQAIKYANGRLFPFGLFKILWHKRRIDAVRVLIMGVLKEYRFRALDAAMYYKTMEVSLEKGYKWGEMSWILESNTPMRRVLERAGAHIYKTYRVYDREI